MSDKSWLAVLLLSGCASTPADPAAWVDDFGCGYHARKLNAHFTAIERYPQIDTAECEEPK